MQDRWRILAPVDLGSHAEARVQHALDVADAVQGDLTLLYVINDHSKRVEWPSNAMTNRAVCDVRRLVLAGSVAETIRRYADDLGADLVTTTTAASQWWNRVWKRSATAKITAESDRPLCFARLSAPAPAAFRSILCVVALDGTDDPMARFSEELAQRCDATLVLLHVLPEVSEALLASGFPRIDNRPLGREVAAHRLSQLTAGLSRPHLTAISVGSAYRAIADHAREHKADVVITGGLDAGTLLAGTSCSVILFPVGSHRVPGTAAYTAITGHDESRMIA